MSLTPSPCWRWPKRLTSTAKRTRPRLLLDAVDHRIQEIDPDGDPWEASQRMAKEKNNDGIEGGYWGVMVLEEDFQREGCLPPGRLADEL